MDAVEPNVPAHVTTEVMTAPVPGQSSPPPPLPPSTPRRSHWLWRITRTLLLAVLIVTTAAIVFEMRTSWLQAHLLTPYSRQLTWQLDAGPSPRMHYPAAGPYDLRMGYASLGGFIERMQQRGFAV
ncbi:MAG: hypothetical protein ACRCXB_17215, partial [Aeromonadaceae bacterium]